MFWTKTKSDPVDNIKQMSAQILKLYQVRSHVNLNLTLNQSLQTYSVEVILRHAQTRENLADV